MTSSYTSAGLTLDRYADILDRLVTLAEAQWGTSIDTSEDEFLGHQLRNIALLVGEINEIVQDIYDSISVANATGVALDNLLEIVGLERPQDAYSTVTLTITPTETTTVPAGTQYSTAAGVIFATDEALALTGTTPGDVTATCTVVGANNAAIGEVTTIVNEVFGVASVTNAAAATPGRLRATDSEQKASHTLAVATSGESDAASIYEALVALEGVRSAYIFDNDTNSTAADGTPAKNIHVVVIGGDSDEIAAAINNTKTSGVPMYGATDVDYYDTVTAQEKTISYDVGTEVSIHIEVIGTGATGVWPDDGASQIKAALVAHFADFRIGDDVIFNELYGPVFTAPGLSLTTLKVDTVDLPTGTTDITITATQLATLDEDDIDVTVT